MKNAFLFLRRYIQCLLGAVYFFLGGVLRKKHRPLLYGLSLHFGFEKDEKDPNAKPDPTVPGISEKELIGDDVAIDLTRIVPLGGNISVEELAVISALVKSRKPQVCFEIGTFDGRTTENIARNQPAGGRCYTLDLPPPDEGKSLDTGLRLATGDDTYILKDKSGARISGTAEGGGRIAQLYGDSAKFDFSPYEGKIDLMFVDGSHSHEYVLADSETAWKAVRPGGLILWHDYDSRWWPGVTRALNELQRTNRFATLRHIRGTALCVMVRP
ncbi:MAG: class I SAM-dependent methyltransferase [Kiritimatiellae bacterium]|nr:class I SAM-dependent methyltransferase [Kiritimatiellia bacterium]